MKDISQHFSPSSPSLLIPAPHTLTLIDGGDGEAEPEVGLRQDEPGEDGGGDVDACPASLAQDHAGHLRLTPARGGEGGCTATQ